jgi:hypothetical protein
LAPDPEELADLVARRASAQPRVREIVREARLYDSLRENEAWQRLAQRVREARDRYLTDVARRLMSGREVSKEEIAYMRGFYYGARWIIEHPEEAEKSLERAARAAWRMAALEQAAQDDESSPYIDHKPQEG